MDRLDRERALHRRERTQARVRALQFLHDKAVSRVAHACAAVFFEIRSVKAETAHARDQMFREPGRAMTRNDLGQDFLLHKVQRPVARCALFIRQKLFNAIIIE